jgi:hypothetical protein
MVANLWKRPAEKPFLVKYRRQLASRHFGARLTVERNQHVTVSAKVRVEQGTVRETYSPSAWGRAICKYSVDFEINGERYSAWVNPHDGGYYSDCPDPQREGLFEFVAELEQIIRQPKPHLDSLTVRKFLCEHLRAMIEVETELRYRPASECEYELLKSSSR